MVELMGYTWSFTIMLLYVSKSSLLMLGMQFKSVNGDQRSGKNMHINL